MSPVYFVTYLPGPYQRCTDVAGFNVHANTCARANDVYADPPSPDE
jgi:hypothetical protein